MVVVLMGFDPDAMDLPSEMGEMVGYKAENVGVVRLASFSGTVVL